MEGHEEGLGQESDSTVIVHTFIKIWLQVSSMFKSKVEPLLKIICESSYQQHVGKSEQPVIYLPIFNCCST